MVSVSGAPSFKEWADTEHDSHGILAVALGYRSSIDPDGSWGRAG